MPICWKVVKHDRTSCILPPNCEHSLKYPVGAVVTEKMRVAGIMCFKTKKQAEKFKNHFVERKIKMKIIKVFGIGRGIKLNYVIGTQFNSPIKFIGTNILKCLLSFSRQYGETLSVYGYIRRTPEETITYKAVKVIT